MSDVKGAIDTLCKYLHFGANVEIKPEHFKLAKFNTDNKSSVSSLAIMTILFNLTILTIESNFLFQAEAFWDALYVLSSVAVKDIQKDFSFANRGIKFCSFFSYLKKKTMLIILILMELMQIFQTKLQSLN